MPKRKKPVLEDYTAAGLMKFVKSEALNPDEEVIALVELYLAIRTKELKKSLLSAAVYLAELSYQEQNHNPTKH